MQLHLTSVDSTSLRPLMAFIGQLAASLLCLLFRGNLLVQNSVYRVNEPLPRGWHGRDMLQGYTDTGAGRT